MCTTLTLYKQTIQPHNAYRVVNTEYSTHRVGHLSASPSASLSMSLFSAYHIPGLGHAHDRFNVAHGDGDTPASDTFAPHLSIP